MKQLNNRNDKIAFLKGLVAGSRTRKELLDRPPRLWFKKGDRYLGELADGTKVNYDESEFMGFQAENSMRHYLIFKQAKGCHPILDHV